MPVEKGFANVNTAVHICLNVNGLLLCYLFVILRRNKNVQSQTCPKKAIWW